MAGQPGRTPLVGRSEELAGLLGMCAGDTGGIALVTGDAGIGKTRLLDELSARVAATGTLVLRGHAVAGGGAFRPVAQALVRAAPPALADDARLAPYRAVLARVLPAWPASGPAGQHLVDPVVVLGEAVLELLRVLSAARRCLLVLDDMHWADRDTLTLLEYLGDGLAELPVQVVLAARTDDEAAPAALQALRRRARTTRLRPLDDAQVAVLARRCAGADVSEDVLAFLVAAVDGVPFLVEELFAGLVEAGRVRRDRTGWHGAGPLIVRVPGTFAELVGRRVGALPAAARSAVRTAAVLGGEVDWALLALVTGLDGGEIAAVVRSVVDAKLLVADDGTGAVRWRHALTRDAVLSGLAAPERAELCRRAAAALGSGPLQGDRLALAADLHARGGSPVEAARMLLRLGREAVSAGALASAEDVLAAAAEHAPGDPGLAAAVAVERVRVLALGARTDEAVALGDAVLHQVGAQARRALAVALARACVAAERWAQAQSYLDLAAGDGPDPAALALAAHVALGLGDRDGALLLADAAVAAGAAVPEAVCEALEITGRALRRADPPASEAAFAEAERLAAAHGLTPWRIRALAELGTHDILGSRGTRRLEEARALALGCGLLGTATVLDLQIMAGVTSSDGHVMALPIAVACEEQSRRLHLPGPRAHALVFVARGMFWADRGDESRAARDESDRIGANPMSALMTRDSLLGYAAWLDHDDVAGAAGLAAALAHVRRSPVAAPAPLWGHWVLLATAVDPADDGPREELRGSDLLVQSANRGALHYADAVVAAHDGRTDQARSLLAQGDAVLTGKQHERLMLRCLAVAAVVPGGPAARLLDPEPLLREALARFEQTGEVRLARWCRERLRTLGLAVPRPGRDRTRVPAELRALGITGRELEVLRLVARGLSNAEVAARLGLSPRTVETHVSKLLAKTGATGRGDLSNRV